jgi:hypothetical protein
MKTLKFLSVRKKDQPIKARCLCISSNEDPMHSKRYKAALVEPLDGTHRGLDVQGANVLPVLLQQRHQEVHRQVNVLNLKYNAKLNNWFKISIKKLE